MACFSTRSKFFSKLTTIQNKSITFNFQLETATISGNLKALPDCHQLSSFTGRSINLFGEAKFP
ncbi:hypothetical protein BVRB_9g202400 [Beta vulgaris subsp. vulgaris]|nr:hypothetical protein BVRB_9g202400 [Beta vulgaris subsp. vulgaris]